MIPKSRVWERWQWDEKGGKENNRENYQGLCNGGVYFAKILLKDTEGLPEFSILRTETWTFIHYLQFCTSTEDFKAERGTYTYLTWDTVIMNSPQRGLEWEVSQEGMTWGAKSIFSTYNDLPSRPSSLRKALSSDLSWMVFTDAFEYLWNRNGFTSYFMWLILLFVVKEWDIKAIRKPANIFCFHNP